MTRSLVAAVAAMAALAVHAAAAQQPQQSPFPPGEGRDLVATTCTQCHAPTVFTPLREGPDAWRGHIVDMMMFGAQVGPDDIDKMVGYLAGNFGPGINVPPPVKQVTLPDGPGKDLIEKDCVLCHGLDRVAAANRSPQGWAAILGTMRYFGAPVSDDDQKTITAYLGDKFGAK